MLLNYNIYAWSQRKQKHYPSFFQAGFLPEGDDPYGYLCVDTLLVLTRLDGEITRASDYHKLIWKNMIHAVLHEVPKLKIHVKVNKRDLHFCCITYHRHFVVSSL